MASGAQYPFPGLAPLPRYEPLREEQGRSPLEAAAAATTTTVVHLGPPRAYAPPARDHIVWSLCTTLYCNACCLGVMALAFSVKARDRKMVGDHNGASSYGSTSRCLNITALMLSLLFITIALLFATGVIAA
ncbi:PREDICTED: dispanin subfamily A member 2b-like [Gekko japonicus]|uniref:Dispanin subfamily A member 2b-like n=1 Tax=Gekko japonicus TaxID=146911 RepID=A0ABM1K6S5_GEKJA|nr:PREDICTED: dispanin subfamily A member 2b-like [Gekko japonicus]